MKAQGTFSRGSEKPGQESEHGGSLHSRELAGAGREREKQKRHGDLSSDGAKVL